MSVKMKGFEINTIDEITILCDAEFIKISIEYPPEL